MLPWDQWRTSNDRILAVAWNKPSSGCHIGLSLTQCLGSSGRAALSRADPARSQRSRSSPKGCPSFCISFHRSCSFSQVPKEKQFSKLRIRERVWSLLKHNRSPSYLRHKTSSKVFPPFLEFNHIMCHFYNIVTLKTEDYHNYPEQPTNSSLSFHLLKL